ncbi:MAG: ABC transporter substrate-binding protein [Phycisphaerales bacterium]
MLNLRRVALGTVAASLALVLTACCGECDDSKPAASSGAGAPVAHASRTPASMPAIAAGVIAASIGSAEAPAAEPILIGHYGSLTGSEATFGLSTSRGIKLAIKEFNEAGGLNGRPIVLREYDDKGDAKEATLTVTRLVKSDQVVAVLGEVASGLSLAGGPVCQEAGVPMITPSSTNPRVTAVGDMIFRVCFIDPFQGFVCAKFASTTLKARTAAMLYDQKAPYSVGLAEQFKKNFEKLGGTIVAEQTYTGGDLDYSAQLTTIRAARPDVVFIPGYYTDVGNISIQARKLGVTVPLLGGDGWDSEELAKIGGRNIEGCYYSNHYAPDQPDARVKEFIQKFRSEYGGSTPDGLAALGYDAAMILFDSMKRAKSLGGKDLRDAIAATTSFAGVTGTITIDKDRNAKKAAVVVQMKGTPLGPKFVASIEPE